MKKLFYTLMGIISVVTGIFGIYYLLINVDLVNFGLCFIECIFSTVIFIMLEERPRNTEYQIRRDNKIKTQGLVILLLTLIGTGMVVLAANTL